MSRRTGSWSRLQQSGPSQAVAYAGTKAAPLPSPPSAALKSPRKAKLGRNREEGSGDLTCKGGGSQAFCLWCD